MLNIEFESTELILCTEQIISNKSLDADKILFQILRLPFAVFWDETFQNGKHKHNSSRQHLKNRLRSYKNSYDKPIKGIIMVVFVV